MSDEMLPWIGENEPLWSNRKWSGDPDLPLFINRVLACGMDRERNHGACHQALTLDRFERDPVNEGVGLESGNIELAHGGLASTRVDDASGQNLTLESGEGLPDR
jgi:hypothetical protein